MAQDPQAATESKSDDQKQNQSSGSSMINTLHKAVVAGATGAIGRHCVYLLVRDPRVESVTALTRGNGKDASFYGLDEKNDPVSKLSHLTIDYSGDINQQFTDAKAQFTAGLSGIGVYTADVKNEEDFRQREYEPNMNVANAAANHGVKNWGYLSGGGVKMGEKKGWFQAMFSWVKGCIERDLSKIEQFNYVATFRPGGILGRPDDKLLSGVGGWLERQVNKFDNAPNWYGFIHRDDISKAMVHGILTQNQNNDKYKKDNKYNIVIFENEDLKEKAKEYDAQLATLMIKTDNKANDNDADNKQEKQKEKEKETETVTDKQKQENKDSNEQKDDKKE